MNFYHRYPGDYSRDTQDLSLAEHGAYALLLDFVYGTESVLPANPVGLYRVCRAFTEDEQRAVDEVVRRFFVLRDDGYHNPRAEEEILLAQQRIASAQANGRKGGRRPTQTEPATEQKPSGLPDGLPNGQAHHKPNVSTNVDTKAKRFDPLSLECLGNPKLTEAWKRWIAYRRQRKLSTTEATATAQMAKLSAWSCQGHDPVAIIDASITNGWQGLFEPKSGANRSEKFDPVAWVNRNRIDPPGEKVISGEVVNGD